MFSKSKCESPAQTAHVQFPDARLENAAQELSQRAADLDRRESVLNARVAAFEAAMRRHAEDACLNAATSGVDDRALAAQTQELNKIAEALEARETKLAKMASELRAREAAIRAQQDELAKRNAESEKIRLRLVAAQKEMDAKERLFDERSQQALANIRKQTEELQQLRRAA